MLLQLRSCPQSALPLLFVFATTLLSAQALFNAVLLPDDPKVLEGGTLNLTCTITDADSRQRYNASDITISVGCYKGNASDFVHIVSQYSARLVLTDIHPVHASGNCFIKCHVGGYWEAAQSARIGLPPQNITDMSCLVVNWENITCQWSPANQVERTNVITNMTLSWGATHDGSPPSTFQQLALDASNFTFSLNSSHFEGEFLRDTAIYFFLDLGNVFGTLRTEQYIYYLSDIARPLPIQTLYLIYIRPTVASLGWRDDSSGALIYNITYTSQWEQTSQTQDTTSNFVILSDLEPYTEYNASVRSRFPDGTLWSRPIFSQFITDPAEPERAPEITPGSFEIKYDCGHNCRHIVVHWKPLPARSLHSEQVDYEVSLESDTSCLRISGSPRPTYKKYLPHPTMMYDFLSSTDCDIDVSLDAWSAKKQTGAVSRITIPRDEHVPSVPDLTVQAIEDHRVLMDWSKSGDDHALVVGRDTYTVFWCEGSIVDLECKGEFEWEILQPSWHNHTVNLTRHYGHYIFGLSVQQDGVSSGIVWSHCTYNRRELSPSPTIQLRSHQPVGGLAFQLVPVACSDMGGLVHSYQIHSCSVLTCHQDTTCLGVEQTTVISGALNYYTLEQLAGEFYKVWAYSVTEKNRSHTPSNVLCHEIKGTWLTSSAIAGIVVAVIIVVILFIVGIWTFVKRCRRIHKWYNKGVEITRPDIGGPMIRLSERHLTTSFNEDNWPFDKQLSVESNISADSGRGSMNRQNSSLRTSLPEEEMDDVFIEDALMDSPAGYIEVEDYDSNGYLTPSAIETPDNCVHKLGTEPGPHIQGSKGVGKTSNGFIRSSHSPHRYCPTPALPKVEEESSGGEGDRLTLPPMVDNPSYCVVLPEDSPLAFPQRS